MRLLRRRVRYSMTVRAKPRAAVPAMTASTSTASRDRDDIGDRHFARPRAGECNPPTPPQKVISFFRGSSRPDRKGVCSASPLAGPAGS